MTRRDLPVRLSPRPVRSLAARVGRSAFARDVARHGWLPAWCVLLLLLAFLVGLGTDGIYLTWTGWEPIPTGTDAGLLPPDAGR